MTSEQCFDNIERHVEQNKTDRIRQVLDQLKKGDGVKVYDRLSYELRKIRTSEAVQTLLEIKKQEKISDSDFMDFIRYELRRRGEFL
ncbi:hypothetical protein JV16_01594 [Anoxybacillus ayderensis]|uniref:Uncharacterized protein n=1 Tax=Anoxybacillus ayderensis TaxID=265546 RepID=A0A0D0G6S5_9BACL|nr:hypothetical protein [Anoxybacillus ayderensis]KIP21100.1 hypothetical protein JV16_01594 [Anoxybacillus ayderensis]